MKKEYTKPIIVFENFSLSTSISAGCDKEVAPTAGTCGITDSTGLFTVFTSEMVGTCNVYESDDEYDGLCYHVFNGGLALFNS